MKNTVDFRSSDDELAVLERRHPTADWFVADGEQYQQDDLLAQRFANFSSSKFVPEGAS